MTRTPVLILTLSLSLAACAATPRVAPEPARAAPPATEMADAAPTDWVTVREGALASVAVERALYRAEGSPYFFTRLRVTNRTGRAIGADLRDYDHVIYPNQWGAMDTRERRVINEGRIVPLPIDQPRRESLARDFAAGQLTRIEPGASVEYFREFNASGPDDVRRAGHSYVFVSLDGQLFVTDGARAESLDCEWRSGAPGGTTVVFARPLRFPTLASGAVVVRD